MGVRRAKFDPLKTRFLTDVDQRRDVHIFADLVGYETQFHLIASISLE